MIDRRTFVSGSVLVAFAPTLPLMPASLQANEPVFGGSVLKIDGWNVPGEGNCAEEIWITINRSWRAAWR
jgi:hypothetical protein